MNDFIQQFITGNYSFLLTVETPRYVLATLTAILILSLVGIFYFIKEKSERVRWISLSVFCAYLAFLICNTIIFRIPKPEPEYKLIPFWSYIEIIKNDQMVYLYENIFNIVLFIPLGIFYRMFAGRGRIVIVLLMGLIVSSLIEILQLLLHKGLCEFDDVFHNTLGCLLGYYLYSVMLIAYNFIHHENSSTFNRSW